MSKSDSPVNLFVYGTLRREERHKVRPGSFNIPASRRNAFIETGNILDEAPFIGFATTPGTLFDVGRYPALIKGEGTVYGEVYRVEPEGLRRIDLLEGFEEEDPAQSHYLRIDVKVLLNGAESLKAQAYFYNHETDHLSLIPSGDYCRYLEEQRSKDKSLPE